MFGIEKEKIIILHKINSAYLINIFLLIGLLFFFGHIVFAENCGPNNFHAGHFCRNPHGEDGCTVEYYPVQNNADNNLACSCKIRCDARKVGGKDRQKHHNELLVYDLIALPLGLNEDYKIPPDNQISIEKVELGKILFFDTRLSKDHKISCATCHNPRFAFTNNSAVAIGFKSQRGDRNVPTLYNRIFSEKQFWDARASSLEDQTWAPILNPIEMASSESEILNFLNSTEGYKKLFQNVFGESANRINVAQALASFERTLISGDSRFDRYMFGDKKALNVSEQRGMNLFFNKYKCSTCHSGSNFTNEKLSPRCYPSIESIDNPHITIDSISDNRILFKTPTLRNIELTGPYMHNGKLKTLASAVEFYNNSLAVNEKKVVLSKIKISKDEVQDLVSFLKSLTGHNPNITIPILPK